MSTMRNLQREMEAAKIVKEQIAVLAGDDEDFIRDSIEGETNLFEIISALVAADGEDKALVEGLDHFADALDARKQRIKQRIETRRALLASAMEIAELKKLETPAGTISQTKVAPKPIVQDEADIPAEFWKPSDPKLDRKALGDALKEGRVIPGATMSNGGFTVTIRR